MKKLLSMLMSIVLTLSMGMVVSAEPDLDTPIDTEIVDEYMYTASLTSSLSISNKTASCKSVVRGISNIATKVIVTQTLQKKNGTSWSNVTSWTKTFNSWYAIYTTTKSSLSSGTYRLKTVAKVYSGSNYETIPVYSNTYSC